MNSRVHYTRTDAIFEVVNHYVRRDSSEENFAVEVVKQYHERIPAAHRSVKFKIEGDDTPSNVLKTNSQKLFRYFDRDVKARLPADLEEAIVFALPEPYQTQCIADLARRYGLLHARIPEGAAGHVAIADLLKQMGEAIERVGEIYADGKADKKDKAKLPGALKEIDDVMSACVAMKALLIEQIEGKPALKAVK